MAYKTPMILSSIWQKRLSAVRAAASVGLHLVDVIPILKYIPEFVPALDL
jgi:hypothetical protein